MSSESLSCAQNTRIRVIFHVRDSIWIAWWRKDRRLSATPRQLSLLPQTESGGLTFVHQSTAKLAVSAGSSGINQSMKQLSIESDTRNTDVTSP